MVTEIINCIKGIQKKTNGNESNPVWTKAVNDAFSDLGKAHGWEICAKNIAPNPGWLFDLTWYKYALGGTRGLDIGLILESEWKHDYESLRYDFEKLLVGKSKYKVFICEATNADIEKLMSLVDDCQLPPMDETYIFANWIGAKGHFECFKKTKNNPLIRL